MSARAPRLTPDEKQMIIELHLIKGRRPVADEHRHRPASRPYPYGRGEHS